MKEEINELEVEIESGLSQDKIENEFGDVLFSLINYARFINVSPDNALTKTNMKFIKRFQLMEELMMNDKVSIASSDLELMDQYWEKAKLILRS